MREIVLLDSGPLGLASRRHGSPVPDQCRGWFQGLIARGVVVVVPEVADYEVRRELTRIGAHAALRRLDDLVATGGLADFPGLTAEWRQTTLYWADARQRGLPTASPDALDADVILAACAATIGQPGDRVIVATINVGHLARYCDARLWTTIV
ncbi:MAG: nucleic acid-binding protein [Isosphaeraceae bacterium]